MQLPLKRTLIALSAVMILVAALLAGISWYLLDYALRPGDRSRDESRAWREMDARYPGLEEWRDSLQQAHAWHDTLVIAPDGTPLHAYYIRTRPATARTALLIHGYTDCAVRMMHLGRMYERQLGANLLVPDLRNAGRSGGDHFQMGWADRLDAKLWAALAPRLFGDSVRLVVHGVSMGAATTMMLAGEADLPEGVRAFVEDCGYTTVDDQFTKELRAQFGLPRFPLIPAASLLCRLRYGWDFGEASSIEAVRRCDKPMLFIHGTADTYVPVEMVHPLYQAKSRPKALWLAPGAAHARSYATHPEEYLRRTRQFLREAGW